MDQHLLKAIYKYNIDKTIKFLIRRPLLNNTILTIYTDLPITKIVESNVDKDLYFYAY